MNCNPIFASAYKVAGVKTCGRLASTKLLDIFGGNAQNQPDSIRRLFIPRAPNRSFVQNDLEGAEAVIVALLCCEGWFRELVRLKIKHHNFVCIKLFPAKFAEFLTSSEISDLTPTSLATHPAFKAIIKHCKSLPREYDIAKRVVHSANYGGGWHTVQQTILLQSQGLIVLSAAECKQFLLTIFTLFPELKIFHKIVDSYIEVFQPLTNLFGHKLHFIERYTSGLVRLGLSAVPQSTVGLLMLKAALDMQIYIGNYQKDWHVCTVTHDSALLDVPTEEAVEAADTLKVFMTHTFTSPIDGWQCEIGTERQIGQNWGKFHPTENPNGLKVI